MSLHRSICPGSLNEKALTYLGRALQSRKEGDRELYLFWTCLSLELLAKRALAKIHPSLIVDTSRDKSALAAVGRYHGDDIRTISCDVAFSRVKLLLPKAHHQRISAISGMTNKRNAELHSGDTAMKSPPSHWEGTFWRAAESILSVNEEDLNDWLFSRRVEFGIDIDHVLHILHAKSVSRTSAEIQNWGKLSPEQKSARAHQAESIPRSAVIESITRDTDDGGADEYDELRCPVCSFDSAIIGGDFVEGDAEVKFEDSEYYEITELILIPHEFYCPCCKVYCTDSNSGRMIDGYKFIPEEYAIGEMRNKIDPSSPETGELPRPD